MEFSTPNQKFWKGTQPLLSQGANFMTCKISSRTTNLPMHYWVSSPDTSPRFWLEPQS